jgi:hypothetical protein
MTPSPDPSPLSPDGESELLRVRRVNQSWIVHGRLRETAERWLEHLCQVDPPRLEKSCWLALFLTRYRKAVLRDPKPLFYAGLFAFATRAEAEEFLPGHPMTRAITLLGLGDAAGLDPLPDPAAALARGIATEVRAILDGCRA